MWQINQKEKEAKIKEYESHLLYLCKKAEDMYNYLWIGENFVHEARNIYLTQGVRILEEINKLRSSVI